MADRGWHTTKAKDIDVVFFTSVGRMALMVPG
jgi:hypothetical protein